jgi:hypothetical protein
MEDARCPIKFTAITLKLDSDFFAGRWARATDRKNRFGKYPFAVPLFDRFILRQVEPTTVS